MFDVKSKERDRERWVGCVGGLGGAGGAEVGVSTGRSLMSTHRIVELKIEGKKFICR